MQLLVTAVKSADCLSGRFLGLDVRSGIAFERPGVVKGSPMLFRMRLMKLALLLVTLLSLSCSKQLIPNTDVEDNSFNRKVVEFCEEYRHAVERRNVGLLLKLAHKSYYEDGGNIDAMDDLDYAGLKGYLTDRFRDTKAIRYEIRYRRVGFGRNDEVFVDYTYSASYQMITTDGDVWRRSVADNRLELVADGESFRILAGM
jgi:hypothetical protein